MSGRELTAIDRLLGEIDTALRVVGSKAREHRRNPAGSTPEADMNTSERRHSAALMRVNHSGEIAAQALYRGQAFVARDPELREHLLEAADEEYDHLAWCEGRVNELNSHVSYLAPFWYGGSFAIGAAAGLASDKFSLGFLAETEQQVTAHLEQHLDKLSPKDERSRKIVLQMRDDELKHSTQATEKGGAALPEPVIKLMGLSSKIMTKLAHQL